MRGVHKRDPWTGKDFFFADNDGKNEWTAQRYHELALKYFVSFREIHQMITAVLEKIVVETEAFGDEVERDHQLLKLNLPMQEYLEIWCRSREGLLRMAEMFPEKRQELEAVVVEQQEKFLAMLERYAGKSGAN
jgi:hypothetical protein